MRPIISLIAAAALAVGQSIPPVEFGLPTAQNNTQLGVAFFPSNQSVVVQPGVLFGKQITSTQPAVAIDGKASATLSNVANNGSMFLLVMIDPDAPTPDNPSASAILHWMAPNLAAITAPQDFGPLKGQSVLMNSTPNVAPFIPPGPPPTSAAHRYLLFLFAQPAPGPFVVPAAFSQFNAQNRVQFDLNKFVTAAGLGSPLAVNFMYVSSQAAVAPDFQGAPFGTFPGGNGNAIGLPGSTATTPAAGAPPAGAASAPASPAAGQSTAGTAGQSIVKAMGTINAADGSCMCSVTCPAGSLGM